MTKKLLLFAFFLNLALCCFAVNDTLPCNYPDRDSSQASNLPWFGDNDYLEDFLDSIGYPSLSSRIIGSEQASLNLAGLKSGIYTLEITDGTYTEKQQVVVKE